MSELANVDSNDQSGVSQGHPAFAGLTKAQVDDMERGERVRRLKAWAGPVVYGDKTMEEWRATGCPHTGI